MIKKTLALLSLSLGIFILTQVVLPLVTYKIWELTSYKQNTTLISSQPVFGSISGVSVQTSPGSFPSFISSNHRSTPLPYSEFSLSIPVIKLDHIKVKVESNEFEDALAQLPGTALPGERGNVFITGHSSFTQFYRPGNFKAIFANLPDLKKGDSVLIEAGGQVYEYVVRSLTIVDPKEVGVINPPEPTGRYLSLMTCVPPGLYLKRLIVLAELK